MSAVVVRDRLYAVGGFSGKTFLNTIEYLDPEANEWTTFVAQQDINMANIEQSLKEVAENGFQKSVSPLPPALEAVVVVETENGTNGHHSSEEEDQDEEDDDDDYLEDRRPSVKVIKGVDVLYSKSNGKLDAEVVDEMNGHPRVAEDSDADNERGLAVTTTIVNGSS